MILETPRLILRPWCEADAAACFRYAADPAVGPAAGWAPHTSEADSRRIIREILSAEGTFALCPKAQAESPIGSIGYFSRPWLGGEPEIGYWIGRPFWGQGLTPEAVRRLLTYLFAEAGCARVWCSHFLGNEKSRRVIQKCGFHPEFLRETTWPAIGKTLPEQFYSLWNAEFRSRFGETP